MRLGEIRCQSCTSGSPGRCKTGHANMFLPIFLSHVVSIMMTCHISMSTHNKQVCRIISRSRWDIAVGGGGGPFSFSCSCRVASCKGKTESGILFFLPPLFTLLSIWGNMSGGGGDRWDYGLSRVWWQSGRPAAQLPSNKRRPPRESWEKPAGFLDAFAVPSGAGRFLYGRENSEKPANQ